MVRRRNRRSGLHATVTVVATICFLPCICVIGGAIIAKEAVVRAKRYERPKTRRKRLFEKARKEALRKTPREVEPRLERHLTLPLPVVESSIVGGDGEKESEAEMAEKRREVQEKKPFKKVKESQKNHVRTEQIEPQVTSEQSESILFKLPLEVRRQIYEEAIGGYVFHINFLEAYRKMSHTRCKSRHLEDGGEPCKGEVCRKMIKQKGAVDAWGNAGLLPLLQSCRRIYSEAIEILYRENTFDFTTLARICQFSVTVLPQRMKLIKCVQWKEETFSQVYRHTTPWLDRSGDPPCECLSCLAIGALTDSLKPNVRDRISDLKWVF